MVVGSIGALFNDSGGQNMPRVLAAFAGFWPTVRHPQDGDPRKQGGNALPPNSLPLQCRPAERGVDARTLINALSSVYDEYFGKSADGDRVVIGHSLALPADRQSFLTALLRPPAATVRRERAGGSLTRGHTSSCDKLHPFFLVRTAVCGPARSGHPENNDLSVRPPLHR